MKIVHLVHTFPPYQGGIGNTCYYQAQELEKFGHEVAVFTPKYHPESTIAVKSPHFHGASQNLESRIKIIYLTPILKYGNAALVPQIIRHLKDFDVIHLHWPFIGGAKSVLGWCLFNRQSKLIVQYQMDLVGRGTFNPIFNFYQFLFLPLMVRAADKIIVSSFDYAKNSRLKKYLPKYSDKFVESPLGVDITQFYPQEKKLALMQKYNLNPEDQIILFVGGLDRAHYFKGLNVLLGAFQKIDLSNIKLLVVGEGDLRPIYEKLARDLGIGKRTIFVGRASNDELPDYYNLADLFVLPSIDQSESFGLVILEAMACAKPVIVSDLPGPRTLVQENINGLLVKPNDVDDLTAKVHFLLTHKELVAEWGRAGRRMVEEKYTWPAICQTINQLYQNLR